jgi:ABC-type uncharacterized transport system substrate-binding protein
MLVTELDAKRLEILKGIVPSGRRFALLSSSATEAPAHQQAIADVAHGLGIELQTVEIRVPADLAPAFTSLRAGGAEAVDVLSSPMLFGSREELGRLSMTHKLPAICEWREMAEMGCLASYGYRLSEGYAMLAALTAKMLRGRRRARRQPSSRPSSSWLSTAKWRAPSGSRSRNRSSAAPTRSSNSQPPLE